jgi:hypothetical protein
LAHGVDALRAATAEANSGTGYISPEENFEKYQQQFKEADARQFAERTAHEILQQREGLRGADYAASAHAVSADEIAARRVAAEDRPAK